MLNVISIIKSVEKHHLTYQFFGTIPICYGTVKKIASTFKKKILGMDCSGTATYRQSRAIRSWVGIWQFENPKSGGHLRVFNQSLTPEDLCL